MTVANSSTPTEAQIALIEGVKAHALENYETAGAGWDIVTETMDDADLLEVIGKARSIPTAIKKVAEHIAPAAEARQEAIAEGGESGQYDDSAESAPAVEEVTIPAPAEEVVVKAAPVKRVYTPATDPSILANYEVRPDLVAVRAQNWVKAPVGLHADVEGGCLKVFKTTRVENRAWVVAAFAAELEAIETGGARKTNFCPRCVVQMKSAAPAPKAAKVSKAAAPVVGAVGEVVPEVIDGVDLTQSFVSNEADEAAQDAEIAAAKADAEDRAAIAAAVAAEQESAALVETLAASVEAAPAVKAARKSSKKVTQA
jgi:hypothetical protein